MTSGIQCLYLFIIMCFNWSHHIKSTNMHSIYLTRLNLINNTQDKKVRILHFFIISFYNWTDWSVIAFYLYL